MDRPFLWLLQFLDMYLIVGPFKKLIFGNYLPYATFLALLSFSLSLSLSLSRAKFSGLYYVTVDANVI